MVNVGKYSSPMDPMNLAAFSLKKIPWKKITWCIWGGWVVCRPWALKNDPLRCWDVCRTSPEKNGHLFRGVPVVLRCSPLATVVI